jgi:hypothetical protein
MMRPVALEGSSPEYRIVHICERCGIERRVRTNKNDDQTALLALAKQRRIA